MLASAFLALFLVVSSEPIPSQSAAPLAAQTQKSETAQSAPLVQVGKPIEREIQGGETHVYPIAVRAGQFVHVLVEQRGIDVVVTLYDPESKQIAETDTENGAYGPEPVSAVAEVSGTYQVDVRSLEANAPRGRYAITLTDLRDPTEQDVMRISAERSLMKGERLRVEAAESSKREAIRTWEESLALWRKLDDRYEEALTLASIAGTYGALGEKQKALEYSGQALTLRRAIGDRAGEAATLSNLGLIYNSLGEKQKALEYYTQALPSLRAVGNRVAEAATLSSLGVLYRQLGKNREALECWKQALPLQRALGDGSGEAASLNNLGSGFSELGEKQKALEYFNQALPLLRAVHNQVGEVSNLNNAGAVYLELGEMQKALEYFNQALPLERALGLRDAEAATLSNIGTVYSRLGEELKAIEYFNQALPLRRAAVNRAGEATTLNNIGLAYANLGEKERALEYYSQALPLERALGDRAGEAATLTNLAGLHANLGENQKALENLNQALPLWRAVGDRTGEAATLDNLGKVYGDLGEFQKALEYYTLSLPLLRAIGNRMGEAVVLSNIGAVYAVLGEREKALAYFSQSLPLRRAVGDRRGEAMTLDNIGWLYDALGENQKALESFSQALPLQRATLDRNGEGATLNNIGGMYRTFGDSKKALEYFNQALALRRAVGDRAGEGVTLNNIGNVYMDLGEARKGLEFYTQALRLSREVSDPLVEGIQLSNLTLYWKRQGNVPVAIFFGKQAVNVIQRLRQNIRGLEKDTQRTFLKTKEGVYRGLADMLVSQGRLFEAQQVLGLLKEEEFKEFTRGSESGGATGTMALTATERAMEKRYTEVAGNITAAWSEWNTLNSKSPRTTEEDKRFEELGKQLAEAEKSFQTFLEQELYEQLGKTEQADASVRELEQKTSDLQSALHELEPGSVALYTVAAPERLIIILVTPDVRIAREYPIKPEALREKVFKLWRALSTASDDALPAAQELYKIVLGPIEKDLAAAHARTLMWSLDDVLRYIPIAALHDGKQYVVERYRNEVFTLSSISKLKDAPNVKTWQMLAMGVSKSYGGFSALPTVPGELQSIVRTSTETKGGLLPGVMLLDDTFTEDGFAKALAQRFPLVHIASHFRFQAGADDFSYLLLGGKEAAGEHLTLAQIKTDPNIRFWNTELLTLSACETAMSGERNGREIDGLGEVVQRKGAKAVLASLWSVSDRSTGALMRKFYEVWTTHPGMPKAEALRQAQLALLHGEVNPEPLSATPSATAPAAATGAAANAAPASANPAATESFAHPFYWAPFILIGNWR